jgi:hypothetical protein
VRVPFTVNAELPITAADPATKSARALATTFAGIAHVTTSLWPADPKLFADNACIELRDTA